MVSPLDRLVKDAVTAGFKGQLLDGTLRRETVASVNDLGDADTPTVTMYTFNGIRESFNAAFAASAGIPVTDIKILVIAGSLSVDPLQDDKIKIRDQWHQVREVLARDPANATFVLQAFEIADPDA